MAQATHENNAHTAAAQSHLTAIMRADADLDRLGKPLGTHVGPPNDKQRAIQADYDAAETLLEDSIEALIDLRLEGAAAIAVKAAALAAAAPIENTDPWSRLALSLAADLGAKPARRSAPKVDPIFDEIRPMLRDMGVIWCRNALDRYGASDGFSKLGAARLTVLRAELLGAI